MMRHKSSNMLRASLFLLALTASAQVRVAIYEDLPKGKEFVLDGLQPTTEYTERVFAFPRIPVKYSKNALPMDRSTPYVLKGSYDRELAGGAYQIRLRARGASVLYLDGKEVLRTKAQKPNTSGDDPVPEMPLKDDSGRRPLPYPHQDAVATIDLAKGPHSFELVSVIGGKGLMPSPGELAVAIGKPGKVEQLLGPEDAPWLIDADWEAYVASNEQRHIADGRQRRLQLSKETMARWEQRHERVREWLKSQPAVEIPKASSAAIYNDVDRFLVTKLNAAKSILTPLTSDTEFLRRVSLDITGLIPTAQEIQAFLNDPPKTRRAKAIERLLSSPNWADNWVPYWQDVLAENPGILKPDLNNTGPFRWWVHQSFLDGVPFDRFVTELVEMEGSIHQGGPAAFSQSTLNDAPMAAKADIVGRAFLGANLGCARCHDAPFHPVKQKELFGLAAMLSGKPVKLPATSSVPMREGARKPAVQVTLKPGTEVAPEWPFEGLSKHAAVEGDEFPGSGKVPSRRELAQMIVAPENERFAQVVVNRIWARYMGAGIVDPVDDWARARPSHPELLRYLGREFLSSGYDVKHVARLIFASHAYQRKSVAAETGGPDKRVFRGPVRRRMTAEQLVDSLHLAVGKQLACEELNLNGAGDRPPSQFLNMGKPERAWQMTALSNERDRPALALPNAQSLVDVLTTYGWRQSRQAPASTRDDAASPMQTLILANGTLGARIVRLSDESAITAIALKEQSLDAMVQDIYLRVLSRKPDADELKTFRDLLSATYASRLVEGAELVNTSLKSDSRVNWSNHLSAEATLIRMEEERKLRMGDAPTNRLAGAFRERLEDALWAIVNTPEFVMMP